MRKGFTLMELMIVVTLTGIIAAFAIPNFSKAVEKGYARDVVTNLIMIGAAQEVYKARNGTYYLPGMAITSTINSALGLNIVESSGVVYQCSSSFTGVPPGACMGIRGGKWWYTIQPVSNWVPFCSSGGMGGHPCPTGVP